MSKDGTIGRRKGNAARSLVLAAMLVTAGASAATVEREGMRYEETARIGDSRLVLNGLGVRGAGILKGYVAGLYLTRRETDAEQVYALTGPKRIEVRMLLSVNASTLAKTFSDGIRKNYKDDALDALRDRMDAFDAQVRGLEAGVAKGDTIDLDWQPAGGTRLVVNGKTRGEPIVGDDFYVALLKMFIGERAVDKNLRAALLGQPTGAGS